MSENDFEKMVKQLQKKIEHKEQETYSNKVISEYQNPTNFGIINRPSTIGIIKGPCGDTMKITLIVKEGLIQNARFWTDGCGATLACGNMITKMIKGKTPQEALNYDMHDIIKNLDGLPKNHTHCAKLCILSLHQALEKYISKKVK